MKILDRIAKALDSTWARVKHNPVVTGWAVGVIVGAAAYFGLSVPADVVALILGVSTGGGAVYARSKVEGPTV